MSEVNVARATFLGTPLAGMYLLSTNRRRLGKTQLATTTRIYGVSRERRDRVIERFMRAARHGVGTGRPPAP
jgi:hypothetical protein